MSHEQKRIVIHAGGGTLVTVSLNLGNQQNTSAAALFKYRFKDVLVRIKSQDDEENIPETWQSLLQTKIYSLFIDLKKADQCYRAQQALTMFELSHNGLIKVKERNGNHYTKIPAKNTPSAHHVHKYNILVEILKIFAQPLTEERLAQTQQTIDALKKKYPLYNYQYLPTFFNLYQSGTVVLINKIQADLALKLSAIKNAEKMEENIFSL